MPLLDAAAKLCSLRDENVRNAMTNAIACRAVQLIDYLAA